MASVGVGPRIPAQARDRLLFTDSRIRTFLLSFLLVIPTVAIYYRVHSHPFNSLDDYFYIVDNVNLHSLSWKTLVWAFTALNMANWIPLSWLSHAVDYQLFGLNPTGHHLVNVFLHAVNVVLVFWVLKRATGYTGRSFMVAALFALHPMNVEPVVWVAERKTMLSMVFFLLALDAYRWYALEPKIARFRWVIVLFALGLLAKPQVITLPFVLLLWDYWPLQRMFPAAGNNLSCPPAGVFPAMSFSSLIKEKIPLFLLCGMDALITLVTQGSALPQLQTPVIWRLKNADFSYWLYIKKAFWPSGMAPEFPQLGRFLSAWQVLAVLILLLVITVLVVMARRYRYLPVGWFWFLGTLVPVIGLIQPSQQGIADRLGMADRYTYQAYLGLFIMICWGVADWAKRRQISVAWLAGAGATVLIALSTVTYRQIDFWKDELTLWSHAAQVVDHHWVAQHNLGVELLKQGKTDQALAHFRRSTAMNPDDTEGILGVALCEQRLGNPREAIVYYKQGLRDYSLRDEERAKILVNVANAYRELGDAAGAQQYYDQAMLLNGRVK